MLTIKDLSVSKELDQNAMKTIKGGLTYKNSMTRPASKAAMDASWNLTFTYLV